MTNFTQTSIIALLSCLLFACASGERKQTLADLDISDQRNSHSSVYVKPKSEDEIKQAYYEYIRNASKSDTSRQAAINRIAAMELSLTNKILAESEVSENEVIADKMYQQSLERAAELLATSLSDFPDAENNDKTLYQLARTLDQLGRGNEAIAALNTLVNKYPESPFYAESQFRLAENAFVSGNYLSAEDAYTEVILTPTNDRFYEKSLFKRGWTRYKQELYDEAVDDYLQALTYHRFDDIDTLNKTEREQFDEYFRAIGLVFSHLRGAESLDEYFADRTNFKYLYHTYTVVADIYVKQERYSDAVDTMSQFMAYHPSAAELPLAQLKIVSTWKEGNFTERLHEQVEILYSKFNPGANYWVDYNNKQTRDKIQNELRDYVVQLATFHHSQYQKKAKSQDFNAAKQWYSRYITHYSNFARKDKIYSQFGDLLASGGNIAEALNYYEKAAFDGELVLDKKSAFATVTLSNELYRQADVAAKPTWLEKHTQYALRYASLYPDDPGVNQIIANAAELSYSAGRYEQAISLTELASPKQNSTIHFAIGNIKARAYLDSGDYSSAESAFKDLLETAKLSRSQSEKITDSIALAIYKQGEQAATANDVDLAIETFGRISDRYPQSDIAATGLYDAASLAVKNKRWPEAVFYLESFQALYPKHKFNKEATRQLSVAYLNANQTDKAAKQLEQLAKADENKEVKMTALWQAAKLYDDRGDVAGAIRSYREYAHAFPEPYPQNIEAMYRLTELYKQQRDFQKRFFWQNRIKTQDAKTSDRVKTDRTNQLAAKTVLELAQQTRKEFSSVALREPLAKNLKKKKSQMQAAIKLYGQASSYNIGEVTTESTYSIGDIYREFSHALLDSERPKNLQGEELEQYNILLEDQAFPFEEKAIEFYETNIARVKDGTYDEWIENSHKQLLTLFPVRFGRQPKVEAFFND